MTWTRYAHRYLHRLLIELDPPAQLDEADESQAIFCPYYVPLEGRLGADWGVIVNPLSSRFGKLTFEHADCGCPTPADVDGRARHEGHASQSGDTWDPEWVHTCTSGWCDRPCAWAPEASRSEFELHRVDL